MSNKPKTTTVRRVTLVANTDQPGAMDSQLKEFNTEHYFLAPTNDPLLGCGVLVCRKMKLGDKVERDVHSAFVPIANIRSIDFLEA